MTRTPIAITLLVFATCLAACNNNDAPNPTTTPPAATTPSAPNTTPTPPAGAIELTVGDPIPFPEDLAIIISTGCWQCDGPTNSLVRLRRAPDGVEQRTLFEPTAATGVITGFAFDAATGRGAISTCLPGCDGFNPIAGTEQTIIHTSTDGGASFAASPPLDGWFTIAGYTDGAPLLSGPFDGDEIPNPVRPYPGDTAVQVPSRGDGVFPLPREVLWATRERNTIVSEDGTVLFTSAGDEISQVVAIDPIGSRVAVLIYRTEDAQDGGSGYRLFIGRREEGFLSHERTLTGGFMYPGAALDDCTILANAELPAGTFPTPDTQGAFAGFLPSIIDICDGVIHPIVDPFTQQPYYNGRNLITAVQQGPFLAVPNDIGDCLNVREFPALDAPTVGCFGAGALLRDLAETEFVDGQTWHRAATPAGDEGWASGEFLTP